MTPKPTITFAESSREIERLTKAAEEAGREETIEEAIAAWRAVLDHPCAHHQVVDYEILDEIHQLIRRSGRYPGGHRREAAGDRGGYRSEPDAEADIAECLLLAGWRDEADRLYAELHV